MNFTWHHYLSMAKPTTCCPRKRASMTGGITVSPYAMCKHVTMAAKHPPQINSQLQEHSWLHRTLAGAVASAACLGLLLQLIIHAVQQQQQNPPTSLVHGNLALPGPSNFVLVLKSHSWLIQAPVQAAEMSIAFPASSNQEIRRAQQTMVESWAYVQALYLDQNFSHTDWTRAIQDALAETFKASSASDVTQITNKLLSSLGDPYTRLLQGEDAEALTAEEQGKIVATGMGLQPVILTGLLSNPTNDPAAAPPQDAPAQFRDHNPSMIAMAASTGITHGGMLSSSAVAGHNSTHTHSAAAGTESDTAAAAVEGEETEGPQVLLVSFVVEGSPAEAAGVRQGDVLLEVQGQPVAGKELRQVYKLLSKESDVTLLRQPELTSATVNISTRIASSSSNSPVLPMTQIAPADSAGASSSSSSRYSIADLLPGYSPERVYIVHLKPEVLEFAPVQYGIIDMAKASDSSSSSSSSANISSRSGPQVGYLKLLTFSASAPQQVAEALIDMQQLQPKQQDGQQQQPSIVASQQQQQQQQLSGIIVDLRDNPGGIVEAGVDIAVDFLQKGQVLCIAVDKSGEEERVVLPAAHTLTNLPLVVLVNKSTASTSELVAGALHDELAAPLIGTTTYGKGRTQRVIQLSDGSSTLLVSTMKYFTPKHTVIDKVGLKPDVVCDPPEVLGQRWTGGKQEENVSLLDDPCIKLAAERLSGTYPLTSGAVAN